VVIVAVAAVVAVRIVGVGGSVAVIAIGCIAIDDVVTVSLLLRLFCKV
jgi:hypothetical protein